MTSIFAATPVRGQAPSGPELIPLWSGAAPGAVGTTSADTPTVTVYRPTGPSRTHTAIVVCPGGGYVGISTGYEGAQTLKYLNSLGITVVMLKYRLGPRYHHPIEMGDAQRAIRLVRSRAATWDIDPKHVGIMGFSAGGHLASTVSTHFDAGKPGATDSIDRFSSRPDFAILVYPVISMTAPWTHQGSKQALLGDNPDSAIAKSLSNDLMVTAQTPPTFIILGDNDDLVPAENSLYYFLALRRAGVSAEMHIFQNAPHAVALAYGDAIAGEWPHLMMGWLQTNGWLH